MKKILKILTFFILLTVIFIVGLSIFIRAYLTEDRIKAMIIPQAEQALGRKVDLGSIRVSLFQGIIVKDLVVKEPDEKSDFLKTEEFVLRYDLLPLLHKRIVVSQVKLVRPYIEIIRDRSGHYNYESLTILQAKKANNSVTRHPESPKRAKVSAAPLALTVNSVVIRNGHVTFKDELKRLPQIDTRTDCSLTLEAGPDLRSLTYSGDIDFKAQIIYGKANSDIKGSIKFDNKKAGFQIMAGIDGQKIQFVGDVNNYLTHPDARLDISSKKLDVDRLLALAAALPNRGTKEQARKESRSVKTNRPRSKGPRLRLKGKIRIGKLLYKPYELEDFALGYRLDNDRLLLNDIATRFKNKGIEGRLGAHADILLSNMTGALWIDVLSMNTDKAKAQVAGKIDLHREKIDLALDMDIDGQKAIVSGWIKHYSTHPDIRLDLKSKEIDANRLLAIAQVAKSPGNKDKAGQAVKTAPQKTKGEETSPIHLPPGLKARGTIQVARLLYEDLTMDNVLLKYRIEKGVLFVDQFSARTADGSLATKAQATLTRQPIPFKGDIKMTGLDIPKLLRGIKSPMKGKLSGIFSGKFDFSGSGTHWSLLQKSLNVEGNYQVKEGEIRGIKAIMVVADLLGLPSLRDIDFKNLDGTIHVANGMVHLKTALSGRNISARAKGVIGLDGTLDLPFTIILSKELSQKLKRKRSLARYLVNKSGNAEINMRLSGTINAPRPSLDTSVAKKRLKKEITNRVEKELGKLLGTGGKDGEQKENHQKKLTPEGFIKGLFGK